MVGIGNGISFDMIERGAKQGGGEFMFVMDNDLMKKQIIHLLQNITAYEIKNFTINYDKQLISASYRLIPSTLRKGR